MIHMMVIGINGKNILVLLILRKVGKINKQGNMIASPFHNSLMQNVLISRLIADLLES